jgi:hypothetical protein
LTSLRQPSGRFQLVQSLTHCGPRYAEPLGQRGRTRELCPHFKAVIRDHLRDPLGEGAAILACTFAYDSPPTAGYGFSDPILLKRAENAKCDTARHSVITYEICG